MKNLSDIAKELGVSTAAVSYVYHGKWRENRIHPDLAARIQAKLTEEGAHPDFLGRQLRLGKTKTIGLILPNLQQPYFLNLLAGIEEHLGQKDYLLFLGNAHREIGSRQTELLQRMLARKVDALILSPIPAVDLEGIVARSRQDGRPVVFVDNYLPDSDVPYAVSDNRWGAREAVRYLVSLGRRRILYLGSRGAVAAVEDRYSGYHEAIAEADLEPRILAHSSDPAVFWATLRSLLTTAIRPDAIFMSSLAGLQSVIDLMAELGLRHPDDVMLAGFDRPPDVWASAACRDVIRDRLLVVEQAAREMGRSAAGLALAAINGEDVAGQARLIRPTLSWAVPGK